MTVPGTSFPFPFEKRPLAQAALLACDMFQGSQEYSSQLLGCIFAERLMQVHDEKWAQTRFAVMKKDIVGFDYFPNQILKNDFPFFLQGREERNQGGVHGCGLSNWKYGNHQINSDGGVGIGGMRNQVGNKLGLRCLLDN